MAISDIQPIKNGSGLFYESLGKVKFRQDKWHIISLNDLSFLDKKFDLIRSIDKKSQNLCVIDSQLKQRIEAFSCKQVMDFIRIQIITLDKKRDSLLQLISHDYKARQKRGIFDGVSYALKWLIGTPDADDAKYYDNVIQQIEKDDKSFQSLLKEQVLIVKSTISHFNESIVSLKIHEQTFNDNIRKLNSFMQNEANFEVEMEESVIIISHLNILTYLVTELNEQYDTLINSILFAKLNVIHPRVIGPKNLIDELSNNVRLLKQGTNFPLPLDYAHAYKLVEISELLVYFDNNKLVFIIQIPLVNDQVFNLYKLHPLPIPVSHLTFAHIIPTFPYLAISTSRINYVQFNDLKECKGLSEEEYICNKNVIYSTLTNPTCETLLLTSTTNKIPETCETRNTYGNFEIWHPLRNNKWIYVLAEQQRITISCNDKSIDKFTIGTGILTLEQNCVAYSKLNKFAAISNTYVIYNNIVPEIDISLDDCCNREKLNKTVFHPLSTISATNIRLDDLNHLNNELNNYNKRINSLFENHHFLSHAGWYSTGFKAAGSLLALYLLHKLSKIIGLFEILKYFCSKQPSTHRPESHGCLVSIYNQCHERRSAPSTEPVVHYTTRNLPAIEDTVTRKPGRNAVEGFSYED